MIYFQSCVSEHTAVVLPCPQLSPRLALSSFLLSYPSPGCGQWGELEAVQRLDFSECREWSVKCSSPGAPAQAGEPSRGDLHEARSPGTLAVGRDDPPCRSAPAACVSAERGHSLPPGSWTECWIPAEEPSAASLPLGFPRVSAMRTDCSCGLSIFRSMNHIFFPLEEAILSFLIAYSPVVSS